jgi:hypothetical protein
MVSFSSEGGTSMELDGNKIKAFEVKHLPVISAFAQIISRYLPSIQNITGSFGRL